MSQVFVTTVALSPQQVQAMIADAVRASRPPEAPRKRLLTGRDVEEEYGLPERTLERWRGEGTGPSYTTIGRRVFYERDVLESFIVGGRVKTSGKAD